MPHDSYGEQKSHNALTGRSRIPWNALDDRRKRTRYEQAVRAFANGVRKTHPGTFDQFAAAQSTLDAHQRPTSPKAPKHKAADPNAAPSHIPHLFGRGGRERVLICLAANGPMHVRHIARTIGSDSHKVWNMVEQLQISGLVVKRDRAGGRKYVALNQRSPIHRPLLRLLLALDEHWPAQRIDKIARWHMPFDRALTAQRTDRIFQSPERSRVLLFIAAAGETDMTTIYKLLGLGSVSTMYIVNHWQKQGVLRSRWFKTHRLVSLDPSFIVAKELKALLREIIVRSDEYQSLRKIARAGAQNYQIRKREVTSRPLSRSLGVSFFRP